VGELACVLLHEAGTETPLRLCRALGNKGIRVHPVTDAYAALAAVCRHDRTSGVTLSILLIAEPGHLANPAEVVDAVQAYAPKSVCWLYTSAPPEQVREINDADLARWRRDRRTRSDAEPSLPLPESAPTLRIVNAGDDAEGSEKSPLAGGDDPRASRGRTTPPGPPEPEEGALLTDEELAMLLNDEHDNEGRNGGHG